MSYSFNVKAASKSEAKAKIAEELAKVVAGQAIHAKDQPGAQAAADAFVDILADDDKQDIAVSVSGWLSWGSDEKITSSNVAVTASLATKNTI